MEEIIWCQQGGQARSGREIGQQCVRLTCNKDQNPSTGKGFSTQPATHPRSSNVGIVIWEPVPTSLFLFQRAKLRLPRKPINVEKEEWGKKASKTIWARVKEAPKRLESLFESLSKSRPGDNIILSTNPMFEMHVPYKENAFKPSFESATMLNNMV